MLKPFVTIYRTLMDLETYRTLIKLPLRSAWNYFFGLYGVFALITGVILAFTVIPPAYQSYTNFKDSLSSHLPQEASFTFQKGQLTLTNAPNPIIIPYTQSSSPLLVNWLVIDTATGAANVTDYHTLYLATPKSLALNSGSPNIPSQNILWPDPGESLTFTTTDINSSLQQFSNFMATLNQLRFFFAPVCVFLYLIFSRILFIAFYALPIMILGFLSRRPYQYRLIFKLSLYTVILADLFAAIATLIYQNISMDLFPYAYLGITSLVLLSLPKIEVPPAIKSHG
jgi:hypothetical protein